MLQPPGEPVSECLPPSPHFFAVIIFANRAGVPKRPELHTLTLDLENINCVK